MTLTLALALCIYIHYYSSLPSLAPAPAWPSSGAGALTLYPCIAMAASLLTVPIAAGAAEALVAEMSSDLSFLLEKNNVPIEIQARVSELGFKSMDTWAMLDDTPAGVREFVKKDVGIKQEDNPQYRSHISGLLASWSAAKKRGE